MLLGFVGLGAVVERHTCPHYVASSVIHYAVWGLMFNPQNSQQA